MNLTTGTYTTTMPATVLPGNLVFPSGAEVNETSGAEIWPSWLIEYPRPIMPPYPETFREGFIGVLTDEEADKTRENLKVFKKRFNDDFARKHQILFGE
ncbi:MAG: hypothetical protein V2A55_01525 [Candidatus Jorgensenbacteria bacterium]